MPPPKSPKKLNLVEKTAIRRWIEQGAPYQKHWAFAPPRRSALPAVRNRSWPRNAVDHFILARLEQVGLKSAAEASGESLIRRAALDLTGLPPSLDRVRTFLADRRPDRFERVVAEWMATRAYAERQAQDWLDLARYADSNGYADDQTRDIWPYREWVIDAIGRNLPFDQFTIEQLAGDMLPNATPGITYGATDEFGYHVAEQPVHVHDLHATILHLLGIDHERLIFRSQGRDFRLTDVAGNVVRTILA